MNTGEKLFKTVKNEFYEILTKSDEGGIINSKIVRGIKANKTDRKKTCDQDVIS